MERHQYHIFERLRKAPFSVLMLDYDGTLSPLIPDRGNALMYQGFGEAIESIMESKKTNVVMVTGRTCRDLASLLKLRKLPEIWGSHGWERQRADGSYYLWPAGKTHLEGLAKAKSMIDNRSFAKYREEKPRSVALHWRGVSSDAEEPIRRFVVDYLQDIAENYELDIRDFDGGVELRIPGRGKGDVVDTIIEEYTESGFFAYLGDDLTDEDAFRAIEGRGIGILVGEPKNTTCARYSIKPPHDLLEFLKNWDMSVKGGSISAD